jgi:hypothetical protein
MGEELSRASPMSHRLCPCASAFFDGISLERDEMRDEVRDEGMVEITHELKDVLMNLALERCSLTLLVCWTIV